VSGRGEKFPAIGKFETFRWDTRESNDEYPITHHPYAYAVDNPVLYKDPTGKCVFAVVDTIACAAVAFEAIILAGLFTYEVYQLYQACITRHGCENFAIWVDQHLGPQHTANNDPPPPVATNSGGMAANQEPPQTSSAPALPSDERVPQVLGNPPQVYGKEACQQTPGIQPQQALGPIVFTARYGQELDAYKKKWGITGVELDQQIAAAQRARSHLPTTQPNQPTYAGNPDGTIRTSSRNTVNNQAVEQLGQQIGFTQWPNNTYKSHAELQVLVEDPSTNELGISNPGGMCSTVCQPFFQRAATARGERIVVDSPLGTYVFDPDRKKFVLIRR